MRVPTFKRFPALAKSYCRFTRHDLHVSRVLLTITLKRCRHGGPYLHPCYHRCLLLCLESRPHDLYALGGSTEPVVAPQWMFGQPKKPKKSLFPPAEPVGRPTLALHPCRTPESAWSFVVDTIVTCRWCCGLVGHRDARTTGNLETCQ
jgi:hypothetical protein